MAAYRRGYSDRKFFQKQSAPSISGSAYVQDSEFDAEYKAGWAKAERVLNARTARVNSLILIASGVGLLALAALLIYLGLIFALLYIIILCLLGGLAFIGGGLLGLVTGEDLSDS